MPSGGIVRAKIAVLLVFIVVLASAGGAVGYFYPEKVGLKDKFTPVEVHGTMALASGGVCPSCTANWVRVSAASNDCIPKSGYTNVSGAQVLLEADGATLGVSALSVLGTLDSDNCVFTFDMTIRAKHDFYKVTIKNRGDFTYSYDELVKPGALAYTLGN